MEGHEAARAAADRAAAVAGVRVRPAEDVDDLIAMHEVFDAVWGGNVPPVNLARAIQHAGGYVALAFTGTVVVGASLGFLGRDRDGATLLHSHITATTPGNTGRGLGYAIKLDQRAWCLEREITTVAWTFDPLVRRNAYFNLAKLGALATDYHSNFYGSMPDAINDGDETDRIVATWRLSEPHPVVDAAGGVLVLDADADDRPVIVAAADATVVLHRVPADIVALRARDPRLGAMWRHAVRDTLGAAIASGYVGVGVTPDGMYVSTRASGRAAG